jgi:hypothetical protein
MVIKYTNIFHCKSQGPQKFTQIVIVGLKIYHLATLLVLRIDWSTAKHD